MFARYGEPTLGGGRVSWRCPGRCFAHACGFHNQQHHRRCRRQGIACVALVNNDVDEVVDETTLTVRIAAAYTIDSNGIRNDRHPVGIATGKRRITASIVDTDQARRMAAAVDGELTKGDVSVILAGCSTIVSPCRLRFL